MSRSLKAMYPDIAAEWHPTKNGSLTPDNITSKNSRKVWWATSLLGLMMFSLSELKIILYVNAASMVLNTAGIILGNICVLFALTSAGLVIWSWRSIRKQTHTPTPEEISRAFGLEYVGKDGCLGCAVKLGPKRGWFIRATVEAECILPKTYMGLPVDVVVAKRIGAAV